MASIVKRERSRFWTACYTSRDGRQLKRSTKTTDKNQATEIAIEFERIERRAAQGALTTTQIKKVLNDVSEKVTGDTLIAPTTEFYLNEWLEVVATRATPATLERYKHSVKLFVTNLSDRAQKPITSVTPTGRGRVFKFPTQNRCRALVIVRAKAGQPGIINLTATSDGLKTGITTIKTR
jgi:hypothetical protein